MEMKIESHQPNNQQPRPWTKHSRGIKTYKKFLFSPVAAKWTNSITVHPSLEALVILFIIIIFFLSIFLIFHENNFSQFNQT